jgi:hypothetical protein
MSTEDYGDKCSMKNPAEGLLDSEDAVRGRNLLDELRANEESS